MTRACKLFATASALLALCASGGCKCSRDQPEKPVDAAPVAAGVPAALMVYVALRAPGPTVDRALKLLQPAGPMPLQRDLLLPMFLSRFKMPPGLASALDLQRSVWFLALDDKLIGENDPSILALPIQSAKVLQQALTVQMKQASSKGPLTVYRPKAGYPQLGTLRVAIEGGHAVMATSEKAFAAAGAYLRNLLRRPAQHDVEFHLLPRADKSGDRSFETTLANMRKQLAQRTDADGQAALQAALMQMMERQAQLLWTAEHIVVTVDLTQQQLKLALQADSRPGGELAKVIKREPTGVPFGQPYLPRDAWFMLARQGSAAGAARATPSPWRALFDGLSSDLDPAARKRLNKQLDVLSRSLGESSTIAFHRPADNPGLTGMFVAPVVNAQQVRDALDEIGGLARNWAEQHDEASSGRSGWKQRGWTHGEASGHVLQVQLDQSHSVAQPAEQLLRALGPTFELGWLVGERLLAVAAGKDAQAELRRVFDRQAKPGDTTAEPPFLRALGDSATRNGLLYLSVPDFVRALAGLGIPTVEMIMASVDDIDASAALTWGVNPERDRYDVRIEIPVRYLLALTALLGPAATNPTP